MHGNATVQRSDELARVLRQFHDLEGSLAEESMFLFAASMRNIRMLRSHWVLSPSDRDTDCHGQHVGTCQLLCEMAKSWQSRSRELRTAAGTDFAADDITTRIGRCCSLSRLRKMYLQIPTIATCILQLLYGRITRSGP